MLILYAHPFSSYSWKAQIALDEKGIDYDYRSVDPQFPQHGEQLRALWPVGKFPLLVDGDRTLFETSIIVEYLDRVQPEPRLIPGDPDAALRVRQMDRVFDLHVMAVMQEIVNDRIRGPEGHAPMIVDKARASLDTIYRWLDTQLAGGGWATLDGFTLADCAAAPSLFYADWVHEIPADPQVALDVRFLDRIFDNHFQARFQAVVADYLPFITEKPDLARIARARDLLEKAYGWLETKLPDDGWATPHGFSLADCSAAPALFYADWVHPIDPRHARVRAYRARLLARPSVARCIEEARPYRSFFPLEVPDRD